MEITCFVVPNWVAALQSHSTCSWMYSEISTCKTQHNPNCCGSPIAEYTAEPRKHLLFIWLRIVKNEGISLAHALLKRLQWYWWDGKACLLMPEEQRLVRQDAGSPGDRLVHWLGGVRRLCVPLSFLAGGTDSVITKSHKGLAWLKENAAGDRQLFLCFPLLWVNVEFRRAAALLCYVKDDIHDIKHCLPSESQQLKMYASNPPHLTNSHLHPLLKPSPPQNLCTLQKNELTLSCL